MQRGNGGGGFQAIEPTSLLTTIMFEKIVFKGGFEQRYEYLLVNQNGSFSLFSDISAGSRSWPQPTNQQSSKLLTSCLQSVILSQHYDVRIVLVLRIASTMTWYLIINSILSAVGKSLTTL